MQDKVSITHDAAHGTHNNFEILPYRKISHALTRAARCALTRARHVAIFHETFLLHDDS